jgi:hypothetical protein
VRHVDDIGSSLLTAVTMPALPAVTIALSLYNKAHYVEQAVTTALAQSFADFEIVVVDDGSTDDGPAKVHRFSDPRLRLIRQDNAGPGAAGPRPMPRSSRSSTLMICGPWIICDISSS